MTKLRAEISVSLDGYVAGPDDSVEQGLGEGGEALHEWIYGLASWRERHGMEGGESSPDAEVLEESFANAGAVLIGRRMFDFGEPHWGEDPPFHMPVFVLTHRVREPLERTGGTTYTFVDGVERAVSLAREAAGSKDVSVGGGAQAIRQVLQAGLLDELHLHVVPILLGGGVSLFDGLSAGDAAFEQVRVLEGSGVTHVLLRATR